MMWREPLHAEERRILRIVAAMPLVSVSNLVAVLDMAEATVRRMLGALRRGGWVTCVARGMTERRQHRWFLTRKAVELLYTTDHQHATHREQARTASRDALDPGSGLQDFRRGPLSHDHLPHLERQGTYPFAAGQPLEGEGGEHEHPPWTATSRGVKTALRRLSMLEPIYRLAPDLLLSGRLRWPGDVAAGQDPRMTDFRLLRQGGFYHAIARYGDQVWAPFTYAGLHATARVLRRKWHHRFWGVDCYSHEQDRYVRISNRIFYEDPAQEVTPSAQVVVAADAWARQLAEETLVGSTPTLFCTPDGRCSEGVTLRPSWDLVSDQASHPTVGRPEEAGDWLRRNPDMEAIDGRLAYGLFMAIAEFPAMPAASLRQVVRGQPGEISRHLARFVSAGLAALFDSRYYLSEPGMKRAANMSRVLPAMIRSRHRAYLEPSYREHELHHNDGVNRLVVQFARQGVRTVAGWRGEVNVSDLTQVRPDLLVQVTEGPFGAGAYCIEFERSAAGPQEVKNKLGPYRRMAEAGRPLPLLVVCETPRGRDNFQAAGWDLHMLVTTLEQALTRPLTGAVTAWSRGGAPVPLYCRR